MWSLWAWAYPAFRRPRTFPPLDLSSQPSRPYSRPFLPDPPHSTRFFPDRCPDGRVVYQRRQAGGLVSSPSPREGLRVAASRLVVSVF
ncbi:hypothetical protein E2C01_037792 [Portunus trituberculatus]|uniref:Uncharacterized protein n=1 Tax=Portunus trituberculatus TaxID=210409 RepID=A0A5B7FGR7_PORTR|nr:hypothetical protein [Portunus trituberculatus]